MTKQVKAYYYLWLCNPDDFGTSACFGGELADGSRLIVLEHFGRATRNPPRDVMLSYAAKEMGGYGWAFGLHEALDQFGALFGPLAASGIIAWRGDYRLAFTMLLIPAIIMLSLLAVARLTYPHPEKMDSTPPNLEAKGLPRVYWLYLAGAIFVAIGFADFPFMAYHLEKMSIVSPSMIPVFYALAMGVSGVGSLLFGRFFDKFGIIILVSRKFNYGTYFSSFSSV